MADDWQPGDLALCVNDARMPLNGSQGPLVERGRIYTVKAVGRTWTGHIGLLLEGVAIKPEDASLGYKRASRFRKIRPHTPDAEDAETIRLLTGAPVRERTP